jgi:hypothetical protein
MIFSTARALQPRSISLISVISGETALICSSLYGHLETTRFLVESGANVNAKDNEYYTLRNYFFNRACATAPFNFSNFCYQGSHRVDALLKWRTPCNHSFSRGEQGRRGGEDQVTPPLAGSARRRRLKTHSLRCRDGKTALGYAIKYGQGDVAAYLRSVGARE